MSFKSWILGISSEVLFVSFQIPTNLELKIVSDLPFTPCFRPKRSRSLWLDKHNFFIKNLNSVSCVSLCIQKVWSCYSFYIHTILSRPNSGPSQVLITRKNEIQLLDLSISEYMEIFLSYFLFLFSHVERIHVLWPARYKLGLWCWPCPLLGPFKKLKIAFNRESWKGP